MTENRLLVRGLKVLEVLNDARRAMSAAEVARRTGLHRATAHRILVVLHEMGYVYRNPQSKRYTTGFYLHTLGRKRHTVDVLVQHSHEFLQALSGEIGMTVYLGALSGIQSYICDKVAVSPDRTPVDIGTRLDAHASAIGQALLAHLPEEEVALCYEHHRMREHTPRTISNLPDLLAELRRVRKRGYALDDEGLFRYQRSIAAPILNPYRRATCAVAIRGSIGQISNRRLSWLAEKVRLTAKSIADFVLNS